MVLAFGPPVLSILPPLLQAKLSSNLGFDAIDFFGRFAGFFPSESLSSDSFSSSSSPSIEGRSLKFICTSSISRDRSSPWSWPAGRFLVGLARDGPSPGEGCEDGIVTCAAFTPVPIPEWLSYCSAEDFSLCEGVRCGSWSCLLGSLRAALTSNDSLAGSSAADAAGTDLSLASVGGTTRYHADVVGRSRFSLMLSRGQCSRTTRG